jgi:ubiquinone/menaquinone biosynthesis C-methylase UbiE
MAVGTSLRRRFWSGHARNWDRLHGSLDVATHYEDVAGWLSDALAPRTRVLDLGCGTGTHALALAERGHAVVGIDFAPGMLARAAEKAQRRAVVLELRPADLNHPLPLDDAGFDGVICSYVLQVIERPVELIREIRRVLRPGAVAVLEVPLRSAARRDAAGRMTGGAFCTLKALGSRVPGAVSLYEPARLRSELAEAGLAVSAERDFPRSYAARARS